jgi:hypothetical protein
MRFTPLTRQACKGRSIWAFETTGTFVNALSKAFCFVYFLDTFDGEVSTKGHEKNCDTLLLLGFGGLRHFPNKDKRSASGGSTER